MKPAREPNLLYIGLDDTDIPGTRGTGHLARDVAALLEAEYRVRGVSRHQLLKDERIPFTANNSSNVIMLEAPAEARDDLFPRVAEFVLPQCPEGSDPGLCMAAPNQVEGLEFGRLCQTQVVKVRLAEETARSRGIMLKSLAGQPCGMIGALAGVCLAASGADGRFVLVGKVRDLKGRVPITDVYDAGVARVMSEDGIEIRAGNIDTMDKLRPALRNGEVTLIVRAIEPDVWQALKV